MNRNLKLVSLSLFFWGVGEGMFIYFQPIYLQQLGASPLLIGGILGAMGVVMASMQAPGGWLGDKIGRLQVMWGSWTLGTMAAGIMAFSTGFNSYVIGLMVYAASVLSTPSLSSYLTHAHGKWSIGRALTTASALYNIGAVIGPIIGGLLAEKLGGIRSIYLFSTIVFAISTITLVFAEKQPLEPHPSAAGAGHLRHNPRFLLLLGILFLTMLTTYLPYPLTSNFLQDFRGVDLGQIGTLGSISSLGNALILLTFGNISARVGYLSGQIAVLVASLIIWKGTGMPWYMLGYFFLGSLRICRSLSMALARPLIHASQMGMAYGLLETVSSTALIIAPPIAGWIYQHDPDLIYPIAAAGIGLVFLLALKYMPHAHMPNEELIITPDRE